MLTSYFSPFTSRPQWSEARPPEGGAAFTLRIFRVRVVTIGSIVSVTLSRPAPVLLKS